ncbi:mitochondrial carrier domain-containing protein [Lipomyces arxii]|uniref:mitochondrial carrier domain-containing protein n=1 Tax=Lipomyces arxii TaxID=56418 RepID=UPI0034CE74CE
MEGSKSSRFLEFTTEILVGSISGIAGKLFEYPFDTVKVRLQSQPDGQPLKFTGPLDCFHQTWRTEGFNGFYRGISSPLVGAAAENASLFFSYRTAQTLVKSICYPQLDKADKLSLPALLLCGAISGTFTSFILTPIELIKCKMQVQNLDLYTVVQTSTTNAISSASKYDTSMHRRNISTSVGSKQVPGASTLIAQVYRESGVLGFWRGQLGTLFRETGGSAAWFGAYEYVSSILAKRRPHESGQRNTLGESVIAGAIAGISYNLSLFPADSIKSRMQTESILSGTSDRGFWTVGKDMYRAGGISALYRGCGMTAMRAAPSSAIIFFTYEYLIAL